MLRRSCRSTLSRDRVSGTTIQGETNSRGSSYNLIRHTASVPGYLSAYHHVRNEMLLE